MAERKATIPGARAPFIDSEGRIAPEWLRFLTDLYERTGGGPEDKVEKASAVGESAQTAADAAQTAADNAQTAADNAQTLADLLENKFLFDFELDL